MNAYIVSGYRTAVTKAKKGGFKTVRSDDLASEVIKKIMSQVKIENKLVDDLIVGNAVPEAEQGMQMGRLIALLSLGIEVPGMIVNRYCGSGLEALAIASTRVHSGQANCIIAGGTESMSMLSVLTGYKPALNLNLTKNHSDYFLSMGLTAEKLAERSGITREDSDKFSFESHQKAIKAINEKKFQKSIVPISVKEIYFEDGKKKTKEFVIDTDEGPRADTSLEVLSTLKPVFQNNGQVTAGNSSQTSDGASFLMVVSEKFLKQHNLKPIARMLSYSTAGVHPSIMGIGPVEAIPKALTIAGKKLDDIDLIELNEAFAAQSLAVIKEAKLNPEKVNVNGGAVALGHPLGCTGAKLTVQILDELKSRNKKIGMVTACVGGGQGVAGILEILN